LSVYLQIWKESCDNQYRPTGGFMKVFCEYLGLGLVAACGSLVVIGCFGEASFGWLALAPLGVAALLPD
jgi:hypothetical protein